MPRPPPRQAAHRAPPVLALPARECESPGREKSDHIGCTHTSAGPGGPVESDVPRSCASTASDGRRCIRLTLPDRP